MGDPKQSIYRFRRADIAVYHEVREMIRSISRMAACFTFRKTSAARPASSILANEAFSRVIRPEAGVQPEYVELMAHRESAAPAVYPYQEATRTGMSPRTAGKVKEEEQAQGRGRPPRRRDSRSGG